MVVSLSGKARLALEAIAARGGSISETEFDSVRGLSYASGVVTFDELQRLGFVSRKLHDEMKFHFTLTQNGQALVDLLEIISQPVAHPGQECSDSSNGQKEKTMSLEQALAENTAAVKELTAQLKAGGGKATTASAPAAAPAASGTKYTREQMNAALQNLKAKKDGPAAKKVIKEVGGAEKMAEIPEDKIDAVYAAAEAAANAPAEDGL